MSVAFRPSHSHASTRDPTRDPRIAHELAKTCRPLAIIVCIGFGVLAILLITAISISPPNLNHCGGGVAPGLGMSHLAFWIITGCSFLTAIFSALFITATYIRNFWLGVPYLVMHLTILVFCVVIGVLICGSIESKHPHLTPLEAFGHFMMYDNGAYTMFTTIMLVGLLFFSIMPVYKFLNECRLLRTHEQRVRLRSELPVPIPRRHSTARSELSQEDEELRLPQSLRTTTPPPEKQHRKSVSPNLLSTEDMKVPRRASGRDIK